MSAPSAKSIYRIIFNAACAALLGACLFANPAFAQTVVGGKLAFNETTRFGTALLPPGAYTFLVEPIGLAQSMSSIQGGNNPVLVVFKPEKEGSVVTVIAMATRADRVPETAGLGVDPARSQSLMRFMYLQNEGLVLDFNWFNPKDKNPVIAANLPQSRTGSVLAVRLT